MTKTHHIEVFFDGDCPLCMREIQFLAKRNKADRIGFIDIAATDFDATRFGLTQADFMARIRGRLPDGTLIEGVEVLRRLYSAIGFASLVSITRMPGISHLLNVCYTLFARNRLRLTGRCTEDTHTSPHPG